MTTSPSQILRENSLVHFHAESNFCFDNLTSLPTTSFFFFFFIFSFVCFFFSPSLVWSKHLGIFSPSLYNRSPSSISLKETMGFTYIWVGYQRVGRLPVTRWCANGFGAGPVEGDKSPQTSSWASNLVAGHFIEINVICPPGSAFTPPSQHTEFSQPKSALGGCVHSSVTDGVST